MHLPEQQSFKYNQSNKIFHESKKLRSQIYYFLILESLSLPFFLSLSDKYVFEHHCHGQNTLGKCKEEKSYSFCFYCYFYPRSLYLAQ